VWYQNIGSALFSFVTKDTNHACDGDRQTDRITTANTALAYAARAVETGWQL